MAPLSMARERPPRAHFAPDTPVPRSTRLRRSPEGPEDRHLAGRNLDCLSGVGIAALAGLAVPHLEGAEAPDLNVVGASQRVLHGVEECVDYRPASESGQRWRSIPSRLPPLFLAAPKEARARAALRRTPIGAQARPTWRGPELRPAVRGSADR